MVGGNEELHVDHTMLVVCKQGPNHTLSGLPGQMCLMVEDAKHRVVQKRTGHQIICNDIVVIRFKANKTTVE